LFVVSNITVERAEDGTVTATGGEHHRYDPWRLNEGILTALGFRYQVPGTRPAGPGTLIVRPSSISPLTATVTATAATNGNQQRPATTHNSRTIRANWGYVRP
jgi:hypothetical protein